MTEHVIVRTLKLAREVRAQPERIGNPPVFWATRRAGDTWDVYGHLSGCIAHRVTRDEADRMIANFEAAARRDHEPEHDLGPIVRYEAGPWDMGFVVFTVHARGTTVPRRGTPQHHTLAAAEAAADRLNAERNA